MSRYHDVYAAWQRDPEGFWAAAASAIDWFRPWDAVLTRRDGLDRWFAGAECNTAWNCLDRHVAAGLGERVALIYDSPVTGVKRVYNRQSVAALPTDQDAARWRRSLPRDLGWLIAGVAEPGYVFSDGTKAEHGTMNPESRSVPILFVIPGVAARTDPRVARTIDIAPTLADLLGIRPTEPLDGRSLAIR